MLAPCPYPSPLGTAVCIRALAYALTADGHAVDIVTYASHGAAGVFPDGPTTYHAVPSADVKEHSGPQRAKWPANLKLWLYARRLGRVRQFDVLWGHHVEGIMLGRALKQSLRLPLVGHLHTRVGLELPSYLFGRTARAAGGIAGGLVDRILPSLVDALITLNFADATLCRRYTGPDSVFVRYPRVDKANRVSPESSATAVPGGASSPYAIYSGNADAYQNLALLCEAAKQRSWSLIIATHGSTVPFAAYPWPASVRIIRVESFTQMQVWLRGAQVGVCPRVQPCGYPIKWLNYWQAGLPLVATDVMGHAVFGPARGTYVHGPARWSQATPRDFGADIKQASARLKQCAWAPPDMDRSFDDILVRAKMHST